MRNYKKVGANGTISIPAKMRRELGIQGKDVMEVSSENGAVIIRPKSPRCLYCGSAETAGTIGGKGICRECAAKAYKLLEKKGFDLVSGDGCDGICWLCDDDACTKRREESER